MIVYPIGQYDYFEWSTYQSKRFEYQSNQPIIMKKTYTEYPQPAGVPPPDDVDTRGRARMRYQIKNHSNHFRILSLIRLIRLIQESQRFEAHASALNL